jgi:hypothetical protein
VRSLAPGYSFAAIESIKPSTIIGVSTIGGAFNQKVIEAMPRINERPVILEWQLQWLLTIGGPRSGISWPSSLF